MRHDAMRTNIHGTKDPEHECAEGPLSLDRIQAETRGSFKSLSFPALFQYSAAAGEGPAHSCRKGLLYVLLLTFGSSSSLASLEAPDRIIVEHRDIAELDSVSLNGIAQAIAGMPVDINIFLWVYGLQDLHQQPSSGRGRFSGRWRSLHPIIDAARQRQGAILLSAPHNAQCWRLSSVRNFVVRRHLHIAHTESCALRPAASFGSDRQRFFRHILRSYASHRDIAQRLNVRCPKNHSHAQGAPDFDCLEVIVAILRIVREVLTGTCKDYSEPIAISSAPACVACEHALPAITGPAMASTRRIGDLGGDGTADSANIPNEDQMSQIQAACIAASDSAGER